MCSQIQHILYAWHQYGLIIVSEFRDPTLKQARRMQPVALSFIFPAGLHFAVAHHLVQTVL